MLMMRSEFFQKSPAKAQADCREGAPHGAPTDRGIALVITLLLLLVLSVLVLGAVLTTSTDMLINGYYRNFRGSFYAADSGLNIARQDLINQTMAAIPNTFTAGSAPIPAGTDATTASSITSTYASPQTLNLGAADDSWKGAFHITSATYVLASVTPTATDPSTGLPSAYQYVYAYSLTSVGQSSGVEQATVGETGDILFNVALTPASGMTLSFAAYGMFIDQQSICNGSYLVPGLISGPVFTNGGWTFGTSGSYTFTDPVGSHSGNAGFQFSSRCTESSKGNSSYRRQSISPQYQAGFQWGQAAVPLPSNDFSQRRAVLDGRGTNTSQVTGADMNAALRDVNGAPYPASGASSGVFLSYDASADPPRMTGGGILVEGNAKVQLAAGPGGSQVVTIVQGSGHSATTTTVTFDPVAGTTTVASGSSSQVVNGVPMDYNTGKPGTMIYVDGNVTSLSGPGNGQAAVQDGAALDVVAANNITVTGDLLYKTRPVTTTQNQIPNTPADTLIPGNDKGQVLGLYTAKGDIQLDNQQSSSNLEIDASLAAISDSGSGGLVNIGRSISTLTIVGGRIQNEIKNINSSTRNVFFDRRFAGNFAPPWFPSTTISPSGKSSASTVASVDRVRWVDQTGD
jgi:Tfp pilus assembly protein PilX